MVRPDLADIQASQHGTEAVGREVEVVLPLQFPGEEGTGPDVGVISKGAWRPLQQLPQVRQCFGSVPRGPTGAGWVFQARGAVAGELGHDPLTRGAGDAQEGTAVRDTGTAMREKYQLGPLPLEVSAALFPQAGHFGEFLWRKGSDEADAHVKALRLENRF